MGLDMELVCNSRKLTEALNDADDFYEGDYNIPYGVLINWRKANAIHRWFVVNVQGGNDDCGEYEVKVDDLVMLHDTIMEVLEGTELVEGKMVNGYSSKLGELLPNIIDGQVVKDPTIAKELLPTCEGFFFGGTDYDLYYVMELKYTLGKLEKVLDNVRPMPNRTWAVEAKCDEGWCLRFWYRSSW